MAVKLNLQHSPDHKVLGAYEDKLAARASYKHVDIAVKVQSAHSP